MEVRLRVSGFCIGFRQRCLISSWLFSVFVDRDVRKVIADNTGIGLRLESDESGGCE